jgi:hypothetical protein
VGRRSEFSGANVVFSIRTDGSVGGARVTQGGTVTKNLVDCVAAATRGIRTEPFEGSPRTVEVPVRISAR